MVPVRQVGALLLAALFTSRGLFAQDSVPPPPAPPAPTESATPDAQHVLPTAPADQAHVTLRPTELRYVQQETLLVPQTSAVKGLYVNAWAFGSHKLWQLVRLADETEINAFVVDVKDDTGCLLYPSAVPTAEQIGANACVRAKDAKARLDTLAAHRIYTIARMGTAIFPAHHGETQRAAVRAHITLLRNRLRPLGVPVTFDIFGLTASATTGDLGIGQVWEDFINIADVVLPMVYTSHYYRGAFGLAWPNGEPYRVVRFALRDALERSRLHPAAAEIRPFLQAFTLGRRRPRYTASEIRDQIRAAEDLGITSWVLWNPRSVYQRDALRPKKDATPHAERELSNTTGGR